MTGKAICERAGKCKGYKYWFGGKGQVATKALARQLRSQNPEVWTESYYNKALLDIGNRVGDCSYLVCMAYDRSMIGSYQIADTYDKWTGEPKSGMILWRPGHVGIYDSGRVHELKSQAKDYQFNEYNPKEWTSVLYDKKVDYNEENILPEALVGWHADSCGWFYRHTEGIGLGTYYKNTIQSINGHTYFFDFEGYICYPFRVPTTDLGGWID